MKLILLAALACANALVVPPRGLARRRNLPVAKGFYDEDSDTDDPWATDHHGDDWADAVATIVLASFLLVDLGSPQFEAILFAVLACSFYLLESFVDDLEDPFGGSWTVDAALDACDELVDALAVEE